MAAIAAPSSRAFSRGGDVEYGGRVETNISIYFKKKPRLQKLETSEWLMRPTHGVLGFPSRGFSNPAVDAFYFVFVWIIFLYEVFIMN